MIYVAPYSRLRHFGLGHGRYQAYRSAPDRWLGSLRMIGFRCIFDGNRTGEMA
jgi:hypothetical protein